MANMPLIHERTANTPDLSSPLYWQNTSEQKSISQHPFAPNFGSQAKAA